MISELTSEESNSVFNSTSETIIQPDFEPMDPDGDARIVQIASDGQIVVNTESITSKVLVPV